MSSDPKQIALAYVQALGAKQFDKIEPLLAENMHFKGPGGELHSAKEFMIALRKLAPTIERFEILKVFADVLPGYRKGALPNHPHDICLIYNYVTPTSVGAVLISEWLTIQSGKIINDVLLFDRVAFGAVLEEIASGEPSTKTAAQSSSHND